MDIVPVDFANKQVIALLRLHLLQMQDNSPPGTVFALDLSALQSPDITFLAAWDEGLLLGFGALKALGEGQGELKSMRTHPDHLRKGVAAAILRHLISLARQRGYRRLSLETGSGPDFAAATALYLRFGFRRGEVFADYPITTFNHFYHLDLKPA